MRFPKRISFGFLAVALLLGLLMWPATTRQGVNCKVTEKRIPVAIKAMDFLVRDYEYRHLAAEITRGIPTEEAKAEALFQWTREHIRPIPPEWPLVDDHIGHIIIRGYGAEDQMADVFCTLATYAGIPSFWKVLHAPDAQDDRHYVISFVRIQGRWTVWEVSGRASSAQLKGWERFADPVPPVLRAQIQMPLPRLLCELQRVGRRLLGRPPETDE